MLLASRRLRRLNSRTVSSFAPRTRTNVWQTGAGLLLGGAGLWGWFSSAEQVPDHSSVTEAVQWEEDPNLFPKANRPPLREEEANLTFAPEVPPPITRNYPVTLKVNFDVELFELDIDGIHTYEFWTFNGGLPGPFIRAREGDVMQVTLANKDMSGMQHNLDFHSVVGPGGGAVLLTTDSGAIKQANFRLDYPGLFLYHCAVDPVAYHVANGMYGLMLVEPKEGLSRVDKEFYVLQSEFYTTEEAVEPGSSLLELDPQRLIDENPNYVVFNGADGSLRGERALKAKTGDKVRIFFGNAGPNKISSFHTIGALFDKVYREGDIVSPPARNVQTTLIPAGGVTIVELDTHVPGTLALVDHCVSRFEKGAVGWLVVEGEDRPDLFYSSEPPETCPSCRHHP